MGELALLIAKNSSFENKGNPMGKLVFNNTSDEEIVLRIEPSGLHVYVEVGQRCELHLGVPLGSEVEFRFVGEEIVLYMACPMEIYINGVLEYEI